MDLLKAYHKDGDNPFCLAISGGSTPVSFFAYLAENPITHTKVMNVFWVDERFVPSDDVRNNSYYPRTTWLSQEKKVQSFPVNTSLASAQESAAAYKDAIRQVCNNRLDFVLLGMGGDGHTASVFPGNEESMLDVFSCSHPTDGTDRISLNYSVLSAAKRVVLLIQGKEKRKVLEDYSSNLPIHKLLKMTKTVCYYID